MNSQKFFRKSRSFFGTPLLSMNPNTIRRLCVSKKFHFSLKVQNLKKELNDNNISSNLISTLLSKNSSVLENITKDQEIEDLINEIKNLSEMEVLNQNLLEKWSETICLNDQIERILK